MSTASALEQDEAFARPPAALPQLGGDQLCAAADRHRHRVPAAARRTAGADRQRVPADCQAAAQHGTRGGHLPSRNRIIAGLALGTLVVEAAPKSGCLITARLAGEAGRELMAILGSPFDARSHGCSQLICDGAVLVQTRDDVVELLSGFGARAGSSFRETQPAFFSAAEEDFAGDQSAEIAALLTTAPVAVDEPVRQSGTSAGTARLALLELEIAGRLVRHAGGRVSLTA